MDILELKRESEKKMNGASVFRPLGSRWHKKEKIWVPGDFYATDPEALRDLLRVEEFSNVWECADGMGHLCGVLREYGILARHSDIVYRGCGEGGVDFLKVREKWEGDILTNPPYNSALAFVRKALEIIPEGRKVAFLLRIQFLEGRSRRAFLKENPPKIVYIWHRRIRCSQGGDLFMHRSAMMFSWMVWVKGWLGDPIIKWLD